jgi:hypothetical protein
LDCSGFVRRLMSLRYWVHKGLIRAVKMIGRVITADLSKVRLKRLKMTSMDYRLRRF